MDGATMASSGARIDPHPAPSDGMGSRNSSSASVQIQRSTSSLEMRAETAPALHVDSNAQLSHAVKARRRQLRMKLNSIDSEEGDENVRKEINHRVEQDARDAYESLRSQGKLVAAAFATQSREAVQASGLAPQVAPQGGAQPARGGQGAQEAALESLPQTAAQAGVRCNGNPCDEMNCPDAWVATVTASCSCECFPA